MSLTSNEIKRIMEGALMAVGEPISLEELNRLIDEKDRVGGKALRKILKELADEYTDRAIELNEVASGFRFQVREDIAPWIGKLWEERPPRYSRALLETLSLIAYRQPITRAEIEEVRGVVVSTNIIRTLLDREWVRVVGHKDVPGKPAIYGTTKIFLDYFNLKKLDDLPALGELRDIDGMEVQLELAVAETESAPVLDAAPETEPAPQTEQVAPSDDQQT